MIETYQDDLTRDPIPIVKVKFNIIFFGDYGWNVYQADLVTSVFYIDFPESEISEIIDVPNGYLVYTRLDRIPTTAETNHYFHDKINKRLYICSNNGPSLDIRQSIGLLTTVHLFFSNRAYFTNLDPEDTGTRKVFCEPRIDQIPSINTGSSDGLFGFLPKSSGSIQIANHDGEFNPFIGNVAFTTGKVDIWLVNEEVEGSPLPPQPYFSGQVDSDSSNSQFWTISVIDNQATFDESVIPQDDSNYFYPTTSNVDPSFNDGTSIIRLVVGTVDGFVPVNLDYVETAPTTSDNRDWGVVKTSWGLSRTVGVSTGSTTTRTYLSANHGFRVDDSIWLDRVSGTDAYVRVTAIGSNYIDHAAIASPMTSGDSAKRSYVGFIDIVQDGQHFYPLYGRDYTEATHGNAFGWTFSTSLESNLGMATLTPNDRVTCRVYGPSISGNFSSTYRSTTSADVILQYFYKKTLSPSGTVTVSGSLNRDVDIGFSIPENARDQSPTYQDILIKLAQTCLVKFYSIGQTFYYKQIEKIDNGSGSVIIDQHHIDSSSLEWSYDYSDIHSKVLLEYRRQEISPHALATVAERVDKVTAQDVYVTFILNIRKQFEVRTYHIDATQALADCNRYLAIMAERKGQLRIKTKPGYHLNLLTVDDRVAIKSPSLPRTSDDGTEKTIYGVVLESAKNVYGSELVIDDQKGIEDNASQF